MRTEGQSLILSPKDLLLVLELRRASPWRERRGREESEVMVWS